MKTQIEKNYGEEIGNSQVCRDYREFVELSSIYNLSSSIGLDPFSSSSHRINTLRVITDRADRADLLNCMICTL